MNRSVNEGNLYVGIDLGTTNIKSAIFDSYGNLLDLIKVPTPVIEDLYGQVYDPYEIFEVVKEQLLFMFDKFQGIKAISVTGMSESGLIINRDKRREESYIIPWFDQRTSEIAGKIGEDEDEINYYTTGLYNSYKYGIYKYLWLLQNSSVEKGNTIWLSMCDYVVWKLTNMYATDPTFAARTYVYDILNKSWDHEKLKVYGLTERNFPTVVPSGSVVGALEEKDLKVKVGDEPIPVCIAGHDHVCAAYAVLGKDKTRICNSIGTAEAYLGVQQNLMMDESMYKSGIVYGPFLDGRSYFWMANISSSGQSVEWFRKRFYRDQVGYIHINKILDKLPPEPTNILYYPYLAGIGTPAFRPEIGGALIGLRDVHDSNIILKAIIEGINYQGRWILSLVPDTQPQDGQKLICVGGPTSSDPWMQIKANILGMDVIVPDIKEATLLGAVALMVDKNHFHRKKEGFAQNCQSQVFAVDQRVSQEYKKVFSKKFAPLLGALLN